ncbi:MAG: glycosyltransferase family 2 protein [Vicinamibacterales bacterium]
MKVVVYLPALNEAETIGAVLDGIPSRLPGVTSIRTIVVDDGSDDETGRIAQQHGALVVRHQTNLGTGKTFVSGVSAALREGADIIVSMDADGQFRGEDLGRLIAPIMEGRADVSLCSRFADGNLIGSMSWPKRAGNAALTGVISWIAGTRFTDVSCGFRAMSRDAALRVDIHSDYEYIHESLLNWSRCGLTIREVALPVLAERPVGESRIMRSVLKYGMRSGPVLIRATRDYSPMKFFGLLSLAALMPAFLIGLFVTVHWLRTSETAPYTSLITISIGGVLLGILLAVVALLADLIARLRFQIEEMLYESRRSRLESPPIRKAG